MIELGLKSDTESHKSWDVNESMSWSPQHIDSLYRLIINYKLKTYGDPKKKKEESRRETK